MSAAQQTGAKPDPRRALLARVHIARKEMALAEPDYRAVLTRITAHDSAGACTAAQLEAVLTEFRRLGWAPRAFVSQRGAKKPFTPSAKAHVRKVWAVWGSLKLYLRHPADSTLRAFVKRQTGLDQIEWLDPVQANTVTEGLKAWLAREKAQARAEGKKQARDPEAVA